MIKKHLRRILKLSLELVVLFSIMTTPAQAATAISGLSVENLSASYTFECTFKGSGSWVATTDGNGLTGTAKGYKGATAISSYAGTSTLTLSNTDTKTGFLSFDYNGAGVGNGSVTINNEPLSLSPVNGTYKKELQAGESVTVALKSAKNKKEVTFVISNLKLIFEKKISITLPVPEGGTYKVNGTNITAEKTFEQNAKEALSISATADNSHKFFGWYNETAGKYESYLAETTLTLENNATIYPVFIDKTACIFLAADKRFQDLNEANTYASSNGKKIVLISDGTLPAGDYTISQGNTLLIPFDDANTLYTSEPGYNSASNSSYSTPKAYRTLTMKKGANLTVLGAMSLSAKFYTGNGGSDACGAPTGNVSFVRMETGSSINVSGSLYAWGFITGDGSITANSGASIYENFQFTDFRGGTQSTQMDNDVFPISQYYVQNIEVPLTLHSGAKEITYTGVYVSKLDITSAVNFIGASNSMFNLTSGYIVKRYDGATDRLVIDLYGGMTISSLEINLAITSIHSGGKPLPINSNITVNLRDGSSVICKQNLALLPGVQIIIDKGASFELQDGSKKNLIGSSTIKTDVYVYGGGDWGNYCGAGNKQFIPIKYAPGKTYTRTAEDLVDASILVNGTLDAGNGYLYTTKNGANIYSKGSGEVVITPGSNTNTYQLVQNTGNDAIPVTSAQLHNGAASSVAYTQTAGAATGATTYTYYPAIGTDGKDYGMWATQAVAQIGNGTEYTQYASLQGAVMAYDGTGTIQMINPTTEPGFDFGDKTVHLDLNGKTVNLTSDLTCGEKGILYGMDSQTDDYVGENAGKLAGTISCNLANVYQTPDWENNGKFNRYLAVKTTDGWTFHRFNISITGYNIAFTSSGQGALQFIANFKGDSVVQSQVRKVGFVFNGDQADMEINGPATDTPQTYTSPNALVGTVTAENYKDLCQAKAYLTFENGSQDSVNRETTFLRALKTCYYKKEDGTLTNADGGNGNATVDAFLEANPVIKNNWNEILVLP